MRVIIYNKVFSKLYIGISPEYDFDILFDSNLIITQLGDLMDQLNMVDIDISEITLEKWKFNGKNNIMFINMSSLHNEEDEIMIIRKSSFSKIDI